MYMMNEGIGDLKRTSPGGTLPYRTADALGFQRVCKLVLCYLRFTMIWVVLKL